MKKGMATLSAYYMVIFISMGFSTFTSKYFAQVGLTESQMGLLSSVPALFSMCFAPMWGALSDRMRVKKLLVAATVSLSAVAYFAIDSLTDFSKMDAATGALAPGATRFWPFLAVMMVSTFFGSASNPAASSIAIEYTNSVGKSFGPIRMLGTVGYQLGALAIGFAIVGSLRHLFSYQAVAMLCAAGVALTMPNVRGHQYGRKKVSPFVALKDKRVIAVLGLVLIGTCTTMFYLSFFGAFLEDMGVSNRTASVITWVSVALEIPMLLFASRIMRLRTIWQWMTIGFVLNGIRWLGFVLAYRLGSWPVLLIAQIPAVSSMACFEFFPALYIGGIIAPELSSSAQTLLSLTSFGVAKVIGSLLGGFVSQAVGIRTMFLGCGILLLVAAVITLPLCRKLTRAEARPRPGRHLRRA